MALTYDLTKADPKVWRDSDEHTWVRTEAVIFMTMSVGIGSITEENAPEFYARARIVETVLFGAPTMTLEEVVGRIGLRTNVTPYTRSQFLTQWVKRAMDDTVRDAKRLVPGIVDALQIDTATAAV